MKQLCIALLAGLITVAILVVFDALLLGVGSFGFYTKVFGVSAVAVFAVLGVAKGS